MIFILAFMCIACAPKSSEENNPLSQNYFLGTSSGAYVLRFNNDNTVQIVGSGMGRDVDKRTNHYATYTLDGSALTLMFGSEVYYGVVLDNGNSIMFGERVFSKTTPETISKKTLEVFD